MITTYYIKQPGQPHAIGDVDYLRENYRKPGNELWRITEEDEGEAAIRRMKALEEFWSGGLGLKNSGQPLTPFADRLSPPPARTEVRVDWDTLEEVKGPEVWQFAHETMWVAGMSKPLWISSSARDILCYISAGIAAIGPTRETALRNLREMQEARKVKA